jgi:hypothetical protein
MAGLALVLVASRNLFPGLVRIARGLIAISQVEHVLHVAVEEKPGGEAAGRLVARLLRLALTPRLLAS